MGHMLSTIAGTMLLLAAGAGLAEARDTPTLGAANPYRLMVDPGGKPQKIDISGTAFENDGHPNRDEYMHWQVRRDDGTWEPCARWSSNATNLCRGTGWSGNLEVLEIGGKYLAREGFVELRVSAGLADERDLNPPGSPYRQATGWSNVLRVPVVVPGAPPVIKSLSRKEFLTNGKPGDYRFFIEATNLGKQPVVVFRGDTVVWPERIEGGNRIQVSVPEKYRRTTPGELSLTVRTDKGGDSAFQYIRFVEPPKLAPRPVGSGAIKAIAPALGK